MNLLLGEYCRVLVLLVPVFAHGNDKAQPHKHKKNYIKIHH